MTEIANIRMEDTQKNRILDGGMALSSSTSDNCSKDKSAKENTTGRWTSEEHQLFLEGLKIHKKQWKLIAELIKTRTVVQIRTHAQKYFQKLLKTAKSEDFENGSIPDYIAAAAKSSKGLGFDDDLDCITSEDSNAPKEDAKKAIKVSRSRSSSMVDDITQRSKKQKTECNKLSKMITLDTSSTIGDIFLEGGSNKVYIGDIEEDLTSLDPNSWHNGFDFVNWFVPSQHSNNSNNITNNNNATNNTITINHNHNNITLHFREQRCRENSIATSVESLDQDVDEFKIDTSDLVVFGVMEDSNTASKKRDLQQMQSESESDNQTDYCGGESGESSSDGEQSSSIGDMLEHSSNEWDEDEILVHGLLEVLA